jgi:hypothetical protein
MPLESEDTMNTLYKAIITGPDGTHQQTCRGQWGGTDVATMVETFRRHWPNATVRKGGKVTRVRLVHPDGSSTLFQLREVA